MAEPKIVQAIAPIFKLIPEVITSLQNFTQTIEIVDLTQTDITLFKRKLVGCMVLTKDRKILLQMRSENRRSFPGCLSMFGGHIEEGEEPMQALLREMYEELGAIVNESEVVSFGAITEAATNYTDLVYLYFWHDYLGTITGCYEDQPLYFDNIESAISHPKAMDDIPWLLERCRNLGIL